MTLRRPLLLLSMSAMLPLLVLSAALGWFLLREQSASMEQEALFRVRQLATAISRDLTAQIDLLETITETKDFDGGPELDALRDFLSRVQRQHPNWRALRLSTAAEQVLVDFPEQVAGGRIVDLTSHRQAVEQRRPVIGHMLRGPGREPAFAIRVPVLRGGELKYVLSAVVAPVAMAKLLRDVGLPPEWIGTVIDGDGYVVARTAGPSSMIGERASATALDARRKATEGIYEGLTLEGTATLSVFRQVGIAGWSVHIGVPSVIFRAPQRQALLLVIVAAAGTLILAALFSWLLLRELAVQRHNASELERVRRLEALGRMTGGVAHDFNNLLMIIQGSAEGIKRRRSDQERINSYTDAILTATQRGQSLTS